MNSSVRRTKIVATLGPSSTSRETIHKLILAGMDVARLNFSHGDYETHAGVIRTLRELSAESGKPVTILQDLQGPKIRVGKLSGGIVELEKDALVRLVPDLGEQGTAEILPIDYGELAGEARPGMQVLLDDGLLELRVEKVEKKDVLCRVVQGGPLKSRKGVNFPNLNLRLPSLTEKDKADLEFGLQHEVDWISLSFVRSADDIRTLKDFIREHGQERPVIAKIEKPQAIDHLDEIIQEAHGIMVARGDLGVEMSPERVPLLQKQIIEKCNRIGRPVITATQMLESMIHEPRPTRAEASDVANAIIDGTDCVMLSGETAAGEFPVRAVEMMARIALEVEAKIKFKSYPPEGHKDIMALAEASNTIASITGAEAIVVHTTSGRSARYVAAERPKAKILAITPIPQVFHALNLVWGITPLLIQAHYDSLETMSVLVLKTLRDKELVRNGEKIVILGGIPAGIPGGTNFLKIETA